MGEGRRRETSIEGRSTRPVPAEGRHGEKRKGKEEERNGEFEGELGSHEAGDTNVERDIIET